MIISLPGFKSTDLQPAPVSTIGWQQPVLQQNNQPSGLAEHSAMGQGGKADTSRCHCFGSLIWSCTYGCYICSGYATSRHPIWHSYHGMDRQRPGYVSGSLFQKKLSKAEMLILWKLVSRRPIWMLNSDGLWASRNFPRRRERNATKDMGLVGVYLSMCVKFWG